VSQPITAPVLAGLRGRCPRCGGGGLFVGLLGLKPACETCGLDYAFADSGDGPAFFVMTIVGLVVVVGALGLELSYEPPYWVHALVWPLVILVMSLGLLRPLKGAMIAVQYASKAGEARLDR